MYIIKNGIIHQPGGKVLTGMDIQIEGSRIEKIAENIVYKEAEVIDAEGMDIFPGMILPATAVGVTDYSNMKAPDSCEWEQPMYPQLCVRYALDMREVHLQKYEEYGITAFGACPGTKALVAGQTGVYHIYGDNAAKMAVREPAALKVNFCSDVKSAFGGKGRYPMTRMGMAALLRNALREAADELKKEEEQKTPNAGREVLKKVLRREIPVLANVITSAEAAVMLELSEEFGFRVILHNAYDLAGLEDEIIRRKDSVSILLGDLYVYGYAVEYKTNADLYRRLIKAGVTVGLSNSGDGGTSGKEILLWSGMKLVSEGMSPDTVMDMMTIENAKILGTEDVIGSIEEGKTADLVIWSSHPVKTYQAQAVLCMSEGKIVMKKKKPEYEKNAFVSPEKKLPFISQADSYLIRGAVIHGTDSGEVQIGDILIKDGKIAKIGNNLEAKNTVVIEAAGYQVLPGLVDAHSHQGGFGILNPQSADLNEMTDPVTPQVRAIDAVDINDKNFQSMHRYGVTSVCITPGSGNVICGQAFAAKTYGNNIREMALKSPCALKIALGCNPKGVYGAKGAMPMTRMGIASVLFDTFEKAAEYKKQKEQGKNPPYQEKYEAMIPALSGDVPLKIHCEQFDMMTAIELAQKYDCRLTIEHAWAASAFYDELKESGCYINFGPTGVPEGYGELTGADLKMAAELERRGVTVSLISDSPIFSEDILYTQMGEVVRDGISYECVLKMVTKNPAEALGIDSHVGSIREGMDADLAVFYHLPGMDADAECCLVFMDGKPVYQKQQR